MVIHATQRLNMGVGISLCRCVYLVGMCNIHGMVCDEMSVVEECGIIWLL